MEFEGSPVKALIDTGSPVITVSLKFLTMVLAKQRLPKWHPSDWKGLVEKRLKPTILSLQSYCGGEVNLVREIRVTINKQATPWMQLFRLSWCLC